ncbi:DUF2339 domain-containing protein [Rufibacter glacialis]|uniref:DUF2339 domain-containing protein n=1 Tax=Rufibacter glacialis TaxID=1259555 RepID=A0A5M8QQ11_9BACT|nr:DUF2339 domain-containing protein [Rufibacter glacialis]KAA6437130.1 DUF2339 domain-containing protein [Rufibacter glacialis]GGK61865.1 membrane protein [Rufibacter glacialis]
MELLLLLGLLLVAIWFGTKISRHLVEHRQEMEAVREELARLREQINRSPVRPPGETAKAASWRETASTTASAPLTAAAAPPLPPSVVQRAPVNPPPIPAPVERPLEAPKLTEVPEPTPIAAFTSAQETSVFQDLEPAPPSFFSRKLDWEKFIGENLINKLGIAILVLGIGFFVKYAVDQDWINEVGRVAIGLLAGGVLLGVAHWLRREYKAFSSVLIGGGMAVLYFTIAIAFHEYQIFSQTVAFVLMMALTGFTIFLSMAYDRMELAVLALIGGFGSPFMVSTGEGNYVVLFVFILLLNLGILVLAYFKKWNLLNLIAYGFTLILYGGWFSTRVVEVPNAPYAGALVFATLFYLVFFLMTMLYNVKERRKFTAAEIMMLLSNTFLYYGVGMYVMTQLAGGSYRGLFTILLGLFNFAFAYGLYRSNRVDRNLVYLLIGLVLTFLSLSAPIQLEGNYITLFWALEAVLLLWLSQRSGIQLIKYASMLVLGLMLVSLAMDWLDYSISREGLPLLLNKLFVTGTVVVASLAGTWVLLGREDAATLNGKLWASYRTVVGLLLVAFLYLVLLLELQHQLTHSTLSNDVQVLVLGFFHYLFLLGLLAWSARLANPLYGRILMGLSILALLAYGTNLQPSAAFIRNGYLFNQTETLPAFLTHYLPLVTLVLLLAMVLRKVQREFGFEGKLGKVSLWLASAAGVYLLSTELEHLWLLKSHPTSAEVYDSMRHIRKIGFPILWGVVSFALMMVGMSKKIKTLRIISLTLFFLTLLKLFLFDVRDMSEGGKIAAFICLGVLLLVISFMYQKLKNLILAGETKPVDPTPAPHET